MRGAVTDLELVPMDTLSLNPAALAVRISGFSFSSLEGMNNSTETNRGSWELIIRDSHFIFSSMVDSGPFY